MKCRCCKASGNCWLFLLATIIFACNVMAQETETAESDSVSIDTVIENLSRNGATKADAVMGDDVKQETVRENTVKDEADKESELVQEITTAVLRVSVLQKGENNIPIKGARVIVTCDNSKEFELRTDEAGVALLSGLPHGKVDVDVTSSGWQSDGETLVLDEPEKTLTFHLMPRVLAE